MLSLNRWRFGLRTLFVLMAVVAFVLVIWRPLEIAYHEWGLYLVSGHSNDEAVARSDHHLAALVRLGRYEKRTHLLSQHYRGIARS